MNCLESETRKPTLLSIPSVTNIMCMYISHTVHSLSIEILLISKMYQKYSNCMELDLC